MKKAWLADYDWAAVTEINKNFCMAKNALHKPTSDGHDPCKQLWESEFQQPLNLEEAVQLCRDCHKMAPFCFTMETPLLPLFGM
jgi:hypothetical protein